MIYVDGLESCPCRWRRHGDHADWWHQCSLPLADAAAHVHTCVCGSTLDQRQWATRTGDDAPF